MIHSGSWVAGLCSYRVGRFWAQQAPCSPRHLVTLAKMPLLVVCLQCASHPSRTHWVVLTAYAMSTAAVRCVHRGSSAWHQRASTVESTSDSAGHTGSVTELVPLPIPLRCGPLAQSAHSCSLSLLWKATGRRGDQRCGVGGAHSHYKGADGHHRDRPLCHPMLDHLARRLCSTAILCCCRAPDWRTWRLQLLRTCPWRARRLQTRSPVPPVHTAHEAAGPSRCGPVCTPTCAPRGSNGKPLDSRRPL